MQSALRMEVTEFTMRAQSEATKTRDEMAQAKQLAVPDSVDVLRLSLRRPRMIRIHGVGPDGCQQEYHLKVTRKHNLILV